jgi:transposase
MGKTRPPYAPEFRAETVRLVRESGKSLYRVAQDLGVQMPSPNPSLPQHWQFDP